MGLNILILLMMDMAVHICKQKMLFNILEILIREIEIKQKTTKEVYMVVRIEDDIKL